MIESNRPRPDWPAAGHVKFDHYSTRYREGLDLVLKDIAADVPAGTKVSREAWPHFVLTYLSPALHYSMHLLICVIIKICIILS